MQDIEPGNFKLIKAARLIDGTGAPPLERAAILLDGDRIAAVGTEEAVHAPEGADFQEFDYGEKTLMPGLVDCHVHLNGIGDGRAGDDLATLPDEVLTLQAARNARAHLYSGVTTLRDCGGKNQTTFMLREAMDMGITPGPRLVLSGRPIAIVGGHLSYFGVAATGVDECRAAVRQLVKEGADFIKITATGGSTRTSFPLRPSFNVDELTAICDEAHKFGKHAAAHCTSAQGMANALEAGVDTIVHALFKETDGSDLFQPALAEEIARKGVFVNATLHNSRHLVWRLEAKLEKSGLTPQELAELDGLRRGREAILDAFARMREVGVRIVCGSDSAWSYYPMGGFQHEITAHVEAGMSAMEAIVASTGASAESCWIDDTVGTLEPGKQADLLVIDGDPLQDINTLWNVADVFQAGEQVDRGNFV